MARRKKVKKLAKFIYYKNLCVFLNPANRGLDPYEGAPVKSWLTQAVKKKHAAVRLIISGEVVGVGYPGWLQRRARLNGLQSVAINKGLSTVEAILIGPGEDIEPVVQAAWKGPRKAKVEKITEHWFNKPKKSGAEDKDIPEDKDQVSWSQGTADRYIKTLDLVSELTAEPNQYSDFERLVGADELVGAAIKRNVFFIRSMKKEIYFVSPENKIGLQRSQTTRVPSNVHSLTDHKQLTKDFLEQCGLPVPMGKVFRDLEKAKQYLKQIERPVVVKPAAGLNGTGVTVDVRTESALETAWEYAKRYHSSVVIEELVQGVDIRIVVIGGQARSALLRVPAHVVGDGQKTVEQLIDDKNKIRAENPRLSKNLIIPDSYSEIYLERQGHSFNSVPQKGETVFLHLKANICKGADSISINDYIHPDLMRLGEEAAAAFGINDYWGIDLLVEKIDQPRDVQHCAIIELNSTANIENVIYPLYGPSFNSAQSFIDHLFPEDTQDDAYPLVNLQVEVTGILDEEFYQWTRNLAQKLNLRGYIEPQAPSTASMVVTGRQKQVLDLLDNLWDYSGQNNTLVDGVRVHEHKESSTEPFYIKEGLLTENVQAKYRKSIVAAKEEITKTRLANGPDFAEFADNSFEFTALCHEITKEVNFQLFEEEFKRQGFQAELIYQDLIKISNGEKSGITGMRHSSLFCDRVCTNLHPVKKLLAFNGLLVNRGVKYKYNKFDNALDYFKKINGPCIVTSLNPRGFKEKKINKVDKLNSFWRRAKKKGTNYIMLEEYTDGWQVCVAIVAGKAVGSLLIEPPNIIGDGVSSIAHLIQKKNAARALNPFYCNKPIVIDKKVLKRLHVLGYQIYDIPAEGEKVYLRREQMMELIGDTIGISDFLHQDFKDKAAKAVEAIPGLEFAVVHMKIPQPNEPQDNQDWVIAKIDPSPDVAMFHFPWKGEPINLTEKVVTELCLAGRTKWVEK
ncbi:acylphosphatase [Dethiobacter alkaliphilus]|uniref:Acylphosphatase n=1 Tax=Dethiobacter alkaliphilus AHT 1 TaxID=555088 RepID=C0GGT6_DETAL|nr:acylphosphatase [Dethiobacter alkaliphilus]EEG77527.1 Glutathione synthase [Dethiobacter alkaliphilus AHT 1]